MRKKTHGAVFAVVVVLSLAQAAAAQGPPMRGGFGPHGHGGPGGPDGMMGGRRGCIATPTTPCPAYQFTFTITSNVPVLLGSSTTTVPYVTTGVIAGDVNGSTYRDVKMSGMGPWASQGGSSEFIFIKNLDPAVMMNYSVNVTKNTFSQFAIQPPTPPANLQGQGPNNGGGTRTRPTPVVVDDQSSGYDCKDALKTTMTQTVQLPGVSGPTSITTNRIYCPDLKVVIEEDHSDPRFGTRTYQLSGYMPAPNVSFTPPPGSTLVVSKNSGRHGGGPPSGGNPPPVQP